MRIISTLLFAVVVLLTFPLTINLTAIAKSTEFELNIDDNVVKFNSSDICENKELLGKWNRDKGGEEIKKVCDKILKMGFSYETCINFMFPGMEQVFDALEQKINSEPTSAKLKFDKNTPYTQNEKYGEVFLREETAKDIIDNLNSKITKIDVKKQKILPKFCKTDIECCKNMRSKFCTWCGNSSNTRKNNITIALAAINEQVIEPGEIFSFNQATGIRSEDKGYQKAKIISNGKYVEGTGGGVCQVSTTLYNAALLAGLEIVEVHQHSLASSYVEPSRDAMVNGTVADLKIKNNYEAPVFISAKMVNDQDIVIKIYGKKDEFSYEIISKVLGTKTIGTDEISIDTSLAPTPLAKGETYRVSWPKDGIESEAYLIKKDNVHNVVKRYKIRHNVYNATKGLVVIG